MQIHKKLCAIAIYHYKKIYYIFPLGMAEKCNGLKVYILFLIYYKFINNTFLSLYYRLNNMID